MLTDIIGEKKSPWEAYVKKCLLGAVFLGCGFSAATAQAAAADVWIYDSIMLLAKEGYMEMPEKPLNTYSKKELGQMVAQALLEFEKNRTGSLADEYGRISRLLVVDEVQLKLAEEQQRAAETQIERARSKAAKDTEMYVRRSMQGQNRLEVMQPLKEKSDASLTKLEQISRDYAQAKSRVEQRATMVDYVRRRQQELLAGLSGTEQTKGPDARISNAGGYGDSTALGGYNGSVVPATVLDTVGRLRAEFLPELEENGSLDSMNARQQLESNIPVEDVPDQRLKLDAELRYDVGYSWGSNGNSNGNRQRVRARLYPDYNIDNNWHAIGMVEWEKSISGREYDNDGKLRLERYYLSGNIGAVHTDIGAFGSMMAEGNIYDSKFMGVRLQAGNPVKYTLEYGKAAIDDMDKSYDFTVSYQDAVYGVNGGYYHFKDKVGNSRKIYMGNFHHNIGLLDAEAMILYGRDNGRSGKTGYVFTLGYTPQNSWQPYTFSSWLKYYYQPASTYIQHTMNGRADDMCSDRAGAFYRNGGFKGWGFGINYNLPDAWTLGLEFYRLQDLDWGRRSNTIWFAVTKSFQNYHE